MGKIKVAVVFGGRSAEHEISLQSAKNVIDALDRKKYEPILIGIDRDGRWFLNENSLKLLNADDPKLIQLAVGDHEVALTPTGKSSQLISLSRNTSLSGIDVIFPVLHGPYGEDGTIQGLSKLANIPCVGAGILGSAVGMDKDVMKRLLRDAGIPTARFITITGKNQKIYPYDSIRSLISPVVFVKPANLGSSVGISKAGDEASYNKAVSEAFKFDLKIIVEEEIKGREIECAILGNDDPKASALGEIIPQEEFYSYSAKYLNEKGALLEIPAKVSHHVEERMKRLAAEAFRVLECTGMARVDMFLAANDNIYINEINTIPGFTRISMYPKLWEYSGISYGDLIDRLISLAMEDFEQRNQLQTSMEF
ncbi:MAG: D-alanine--D-alanine ligase [Bacteroidales bacterium]|nr:D-alanine--D-alanine ligase [Bacteroidales bacterium]